jgi:hypothetical protein
MGACGFSIFRTREEGLRVENICNLPIRLSERFEGLGAFTFSFIITLPRTKKPGKRGAFREGRNYTEWKSGTVVVVRELEET